jgi:acyl dehydratase
MSADRAAAASPVQLGLGSYWQDLEPGQSFRTLRRTITEADLVNFINATGMLEAIFIEAGYKHGAIEGRVVPAALTMGLIEGLQFQTLIQGTGLALLDLNLVAIAPVRVNDTVWATILVRTVNPTSRSNRAVVSFAVQVFNQNDLAVLSYDVKRLVAGRPG